MAYEWSEDMAGVSGDDTGTYELGCRAMVKAGLEWWDRHPDADPRMPGLGGASEANEDALALKASMVAAVFQSSTTSGLMVRGCLAAVLWVRRNGWEAYCDRLRARKASGQETEWSSAESADA